MAEAQFTETLSVKVTKDVKQKIDAKLPNPSEWVRTAIKLQLNEEKTKRITTK